MDLDKLTRRETSKRRAKLSQTTQKQQPKLFTLIAILSLILHLTSGAAQSKSLISVVGTGSVQWVAGGGRGDATAFVGQSDNSTTRFAAIKDNLPLFALLSVINLCVILGNILVIISIFATAKLQSVTNTFIVSLASADLMLGLFVLPYSLVYEVLDVWIFGDFWCHGWLVTDVWICTASILNLCAISVDRYVAVTRPVKYRYIMTRRKAKSIVAGVWIVSFLICSPPLLQHWRPSSLDLSVRQQRAIAQAHSTTGGNAPTPTHRALATRARHNSDARRQQRPTNKTMLMQLANNSALDNADRPQPLSAPADTVAPRALARSRSARADCKCYPESRCNCSSSGAPDKGPRNKRAAEKNDNARKQIHSGRPLEAITVIDKKLSIGLPSRRQLRQARPDELAKGPEEYISIVVAKVVSSAIRRGARPASGASLFIAANAGRPLEMDRGISSGFIVLNCSDGGLATPDRKPDLARSKAIKAPPRFRAPHPRPGHWFSGLRRRLVNGGAARFRDSESLLLLLFALLQQKARGSSFSEEARLLQEMHPGLQARAINQSEPAASSCAALRGLEAIELLTSCHRPTKPSALSSPGRASLSFEPLSAKLRLNSKATAFTSNPARAADSSRLFAGAHPTRPRQRRTRPPDETATDARLFIVVRNPRRGEPTKLGQIAPSFPSSGATRVRFNELVVVDCTPRHQATSAPPTAYLQTGDAAQTRDRDSKSNDASRAPRSRKQSEAEPQSGGQNNNYGSKAGANQVEFLAKGGREQRLSSSSRLHISRELRARRPDTGDASELDPGGAGGQLLLLLPVPLSLQFNATTPIVGCFRGLLVEPAREARTEPDGGDPRRTLASAGDKDIDNSSSEATRSLAASLLALKPSERTKGRQRANEPAKGDNGHLNLATRSKQLNLNGAAKTMLGPVGSARQNHRLSRGLLAKDKSGPRIKRWLLSSEREPLQPRGSRQMFERPAEGLSAAQTETGARFLELGPESNLGSNLTTAARRKSGCDLFDDRSYVIYSSLGSFYIPMLVMLFFYSRIYLVASRAHKARQRGYMTTKWPVAGSARGKQSGECGSERAGGCGGQADGSIGGNGGAGSDRAGFGSERVTLRIHRREKSPTQSPAPAPVPVLTQTAAAVAAAAAASFQAPPAIVTLERTTSAEANEAPVALKAAAKGEQNYSTSKATTNELCSRPHVAAPTGAAANHADVTSPSSQVITQNKVNSGQRQQQAALEIGQDACEDGPSSPGEPNNNNFNELESSHNDGQALGGDPALCGGSACESAAKDAQAKNDDPNPGEKLVAVSAASRRINEDNRDPHRHHHHHHHHHHHRHHHHNHHRHRHHRHNHQHRHQHSSCTCSELHHHHHSHHKHRRHNSPRRGEMVKAPHSRIEAEPSSGVEKRRGSVTSVHITVSQYDETEEENKQMELPVIIRESGADESQTDGATLLSSSSRRVDRSHSCVPTPSIVVNWNPENKQTSSEMATAPQSPASSTGGVGEQFMQRPCNSPGPLSGSQGSGLSLIANLPNAANQVRKQSIMLLSSLTSRSSQTLRRLSMVATHPVDSLLKRSRSRDSTDYDDDSSTNVEGQTGREGGTNKEGPSEGKSVDKKRRRRRKKRARKRASISLHQGSKKTLDDYLMAVAGIDSSTDPDEHHSSDPVDFDEDDDDEEEELELEEENAQTSVMEGKHFLYTQKILVPGIRVSAENGVELATSNQTHSPLLKMDQSTNETTESAGKSEPQLEAAEEDVRPPSALHRQGGYYERATSRSMIPADGANIGSVVSALKRSINGVQKQPPNNAQHLDDSKPAQVIVSTGFDKANKPQGNYHHQLMSKSRAPRRRAKRTSRWHAKRLHAETKAAKTVAIIVGGFIFCWLPFFTAYLSRAIICQTTDCIPQSLFSLFVWLGYLNSAINPVIYGLFSADFRHAFKNILCRCRFRNTDDTVVVSVLVDSIIKSIL